MSEYRNNVAQVVAGTPGTGAITVTGATVGDSQTFATAYGSGTRNIDIFATGTGNIWTVERNCSLNVATNVITRGTVEDGSSGPGVAVSLPAGSVVRVALPASAANRYEAAALEHATGTDANTTMVVNTLYLVSASGLTANRTYTLPTTCAVGDRVGVLLTSGSATNAVLFTAAASDTLNGIAGGTTASRMSTAYQLLVARCTVANTAWVFDAGELDGAYTLIKNDGSTTKSLTGGSQTLIDTPLATVTSDPYACWNTGTKRFTPKRAGTYILVASIQGEASSQLQCSIRVNGSTFYGGEFGAAASDAVAQIVQPIFFNGSTDYCEVFGYASSTTVTATAASNVYFSAYYLGP